MIFAYCPECEHQSITHYEIGDRKGYQAVICEECSSVYWVQRDAFGKVYTNAEFMDILPSDAHREDARLVVDELRSA